jgi:hypothetical protein
MFDDETPEPLRRRMTAMDHMECVEGEIRAALAVMVSEGFSGDRAAGKHLRYAVIRLSKAATLLDPAM